MASEDVRVNFRVSPEVVKLIDSMPGSDRTKRFENLIYKAFEELPRVQQELESVRKNMDVERASLRRLRDTKDTLVQNVNTANYQLKQLLSVVDRVYGNISGTEVIGNE